MRMRYRKVMFTLEFEKRNKDLECRKTCEWRSQPKPLGQMTPVSSPCIHEIFQRNTIRKWKCVRDESSSLTILHKESPEKCKYDINS